MNFTSLLSPNSSSSLSIRISLPLRPSNYHSPPSACLNVDVQTPDFHPNPLIQANKSAEIISDDKKFIVGTYARAPLVLSSGKGCKLYDVEGREYMDLTSGIAVNALGHGDPDWVAAVTRQAHILTHVSNIYYSEPQASTNFVHQEADWLIDGIMDLDMLGLLVCFYYFLFGTKISTDSLLLQIELAKRLVSGSFADRVFFCNSGTEANEAAVKFARKFQKSLHDDKEPPTGFIAFKNCFHGRTMGALALTSKEQYRTPFEPVMPGVTFLEYGDVQAATEAIQSGKIAAVFVEPLQGEGGIHSATKEFISSLRVACDNVGCLLVFDEVQCGLGRTGYLWAHETYGVYPDIMTLAKPLAGGLPIGAVLMTEKVAAAISHGDHGSTFAGSPLVCTAAITVLDKISNPSFLSSVSDKGKYFKDLLIQNLGKNSHVKEIRGLGLIVGVELDVSASPLVDACQQSGLLILTAGKGNVVRMVPPLIITKQELDEAVEILVRCMPVLDQPVNP